MESAWYEKAIKRALKAYAGLKAEKGVDFVFTELSVDEGGIERRPLELDKEYFTIKVRSSRIVDVRKWKDKFHGCIHARTICLHESAGEVEFQSIIAPGAMMDLDPGNADSIIALDLPVMRPVPYRGKFSLELGLFSVKGEDLAAPYIDLLSGLAKTAGGSFQQALNFVDPLRKGFDLLFGTAKQSELEIGVRREWSDPETGTWLLMRAPADEVKVEELEVEKGGRLTKDGKSFRNFPYVVLQIEAVPRYDHWMTIPELKDAWKAIGDAHRANDADKTAKMMEQFYTILRWSPDLITADADRLYENARTKLSAPPAATQPSTAALATRLSGGKAKRPSKPKAVAPFGEFEELNLYGPPE